MNAWRRGLWTLGWPARKLLVLGVLAYQHGISRWTPPSCKYYPSCSHYTKSAIEDHGATKGTVLTVGRLARCHPWSGGGVNPVPPPGRWRAEVDTAGRTRAVVASQRRAPNDHTVEAHGMGSH